LFRDRLLSVHKGTRSAEKVVEFISDRMSYILLRCWCDTVLNVLAPTEDKSDDIKDSFYKELENVSDQFSNYHMKILLADFNVKVGNKSLH
jgi:hypothetical protein